MERYIVKPIGRFIIFGPSSLGIGCYGKAWRVCLGVGPNDPWIGLWITVNPERIGGPQITHCVGGEIRWHLCLFGVFLVCSMSPTFMLGIWHGGDWLKRDLA